MTRKLPAPREGVAIAGRRARRSGAAGADSAVASGVAWSGGRVAALPRPRPEGIANPHRGRGHATAHHGELLQGMFRSPEGKLERGLVTLPCDLYSSSVTFEPAFGAPLTVEPVGRYKALQAARLTLRSLGAEEWGGRITVDSNVPLGWGLGSSTSDVTASIRAVVDAFGAFLATEEIASIAVAAEGASDSLMYGAQGVLFAQRLGRVLCDFGRDLPALEVVGFNTDPGGAGIDTLAFPMADYDWWEVEAFRPLLALLRRAVHAADARLVGRVASASSDLNQRFCPKPGYEAIKDLAVRVGAVGVQVAHSGTVAGILHDPGEEGVEEMVERTQEGLEEIGFGSSWHFRLGGAAA